MTRSSPTAALTRALSTSGTMVMVSGTVVAALAAYAFQVVAGRALGPEAFAPVTVLWTIQFLVMTTVFMPMEQLTIRRLAASTPDAAPRRLFFAVIVAATAVSLAFAALTLERLLDGRLVFLPVVACVIAAYGGHSIARGTLAGRRRFNAYGWSTAAESLVRLAIVGILLLVGAGVVGVAWSLVPGALVVYLWRPFRDEGGRGGEPAATGGALATFVTANAASQTIVASGPLVVGALGASATEVSVFFETFLLFRAPLTVAYSLIARVLPPFTRIAESAERARLATWALRLGAVAAIGAVAGYFTGLWVGPDLVAILLGQEFRPPGELAALAGSGVAIATVALFTQQMLIALRATGRLAGAWGSGLAAATLAVVLGGADATLRVGTAFLVGEAVALSLIVAAVVAAARRPA